MHTVRPDPDSDPYPRLLVAYKEHRSALQRDPHDLVAMLNVGAILRAMGKRDEARDAFERARHASLEKADFERLEEAWMGLSSIAREAGGRGPGQLEETSVLECFRCGRLWANFGIFKKSSMKIEDSIRSFQLAMRLGQRDSNVYRCQSPWLIFVIEVAQIVVGGAGCNGQEERGDEAPAAACSSLRCYGRGPSELVLQTSRRRLRAEGEMEMLVFLLLSIVIPRPSRRS